MFRNVYSCMHIGLRPRTSGKMRPNGPVSCVDFPSYRGRIRLRGIPRHKPEGMRARKSTAFLSSLSRARKWRIGAQRRVPRENDGKLRTNASPGPVSGLRMQNNMFRHFIQRHEKDNFTEKTTQVHSGVHVRSKRDWKKTDSHMETEIRKNSSVKRMCVCEYIHIHMHTHIYIYIYLFE